MAAGSARRRNPVATIGYEHATPGSLVEALRKARVDLVVDVRAVAASRKPTLAGLVRSGRKVCLLCLEASPEHCHRTVVGEALGDRLRIRLTHLAVAAHHPKLT